MTTIFLIIEIDGYEVHAISVRQSRTEAEVLQRSICQEVYNKYDTLYSQADIDSWSEDEFWDHWDEARADDLDFNVEIHELELEVILTTP